MSEREEAGIRERDYCYREIIIMFLGFNFGAESLILSLRNLWVFILYGLSEENICVYCLLCLIVVLVILSVEDPNIMIS